VAANEEDDIADETEESKADESIQDFYEDDQIKLNTDLEVADKDENLDYSQTHLEDFLKS
jgi:hypothetical protein